MSGFLVGLLFAAFAFMVIRKVRRYRYGGARRGGFRGRRQHMVHWMSRRLEATEAQEAIMREAVNEVYSAMAGARGSWHDGLEDLAAAFREEDWDAERLGKTCADQEAAVEKLRDAIIGAFGKVHEALEPWQRKELARFLEQAQGRRFARGC